MKHKLKHVPQVVSIMHCKYDLVPFIKVCCCILISLCALCSTVKRRYILDVLARFPDSFQIDICLPGIPS